MSWIAVRLQLEKLYAPTRQPHPKETEYGLGSSRTACVPKGEISRDYDSPPVIPIQTLAKKKYAYLWQCCSCNHPGINIMNDRCPRCSTPRCAYCKTVKVQVRSNNELDWLEVPRIRSPT